MSAHGYEKGRLNLPFVASRPSPRAPMSRIGAESTPTSRSSARPNVFGTQWRAGARFGPRSIREASTLFSFGPCGAYDHEDDVTISRRRPDRRYRGTPTSCTRTRSPAMPRSRRAYVPSWPRGAMPVVLGGDHSRQHSLYRGVRGPGADPPRAARRPSRLRRRAARGAPWPRQPDGDVPPSVHGLTRPDAARHPQRLVHRQGRLRGGRAMGSDILSVRQIRKTRRRCRR